MRPSKQGDHELLSFYSPFSSLQRFDVGFRREDRNQNSRDRRTQDTPRITFIQALRYTKTHIQALHTKNQYEEKRFVYVK